MGLRGPWAQSLTRKQPAPEPRVSYRFLCRRCRQPFIASRADARYCSGSCRQAMYLRRGRVPVAGEAEGEGVTGVISLSDHQLSIVTDTARMVPVERRDIFLQLVGAMLRMRGRFSDADVADVAQLALTGLAHQPAASETDAPAASGRAMRPYLCRT
jgi:hypothetical protein